MIVIYRPLRGLAIIADLPPGFRAARSTRGYILFACSAGEKSAPQIAKNLVSRALITLEIKLSDVLKGSDAESVPRAVLTRNIRLTCHELVS